MQIGNVREMQEFLSGQNLKVKQREEEMKRVKKAVYQMHAMIESQSMETLDKETDRSKQRVEESGNQEKAASVEKKGRKKTDVNTQMEKMLSAAGKVAHMQI